MKKLTKEEIELINRNNEILRARKRVSSTGAGSSSGGGADGGVSVGWQFEDGSTIQWEDSSTIETE